MHRTTTTATLLATVALTALSGCVTVQRPTLPGPPAAVPSQASVPRPDVRAGTEVVQAPAREALEMVEPPRKPAATTLRRRERSDAAAVPAEQPAANRSHPQHRRAHPGPARPTPRRHERPHIEAPDVEAEVRRDTDVCALGRKYGGWRGDSPEAVICEQAYGRQ
ncbi:hypothetical protein ACIBVL_30435 [Streptomyces sp. NPDC049687]|uniref:hypothetical protein n=1 Tax=Streptomyces sp. NPDC049687 TaxID=3365596 RepID=UPI0037B25A93